MSTSSADATAGNVVASLGDQFDELDALFVEDDADADVYAEEHVEGDADEDDEDSGDGPAAAAQDAAKLMLDEVGGLCATFDAACEHLDSLANYCQEGARAWLGEYDELIADTEAFAAVVTAEKTATTDLLESLRARLEQHGQRLENMRGEIVKTADELTTRTRQELTHKVTSTGERFMDDLQQRCEAPLQSNYQQAGDGLQSTLQDFRAASLADLQKLSDDIARLGDQLLATIRDGAENSVRSAGKELIDAASDRIATTITESVVMAQLGTQLSSAMAPILPQMIMINKAAEVIRAAIKIFKAARLGF